MQGTDTSGAGAGVRPWPAIFTHPRRALRAAADGRHGGPLPCLVLVWGAAWLLRDLTGTHVAVDAGPEVTPQQAWTLRLLASALAPILMVFLPWIVGRVMGGRAALVEVFFVVLWSYVPLLVLRLPLEITSVLAFGSARPTGDASILEPRTVLALPPVGLAVYALGRAGSLWSFGLLVVGLSEVHRFSLARAVLAIVVPLFLLGMIAALSAALLVVAMGASGG
jgi:hypothetical protein